MDTASVNGMVRTQMGDALKPFVLDGSQGGLCAFYYRPAAGVRVRGDVLLVPPFAEEMNRCRSMISMQARAWAKLGVGTLVLDLYGTGDSEGAFSQARWADWQEDLRRGLAWLRSHGNGCSMLWGIRLGAILAAEVAAEDAQVHHLLYWQPVTDGRAFWTQFLRVRIAAEMELEDGIRSTEELRKRSREGGVVEVSGYPVGPELAQHLDTLRMPTPERLGGKHVHWYEILADAEARMSRANAAAVESLRSGAIETDVVEIIAPLFWHVHERTLVPELVQATSALVERTLPADMSEGASVPDAGCIGRVNALGEYPTAFQCGAEQLSGVIHRGDPRERCGIVIVVAGGPQYRVGAHRQFMEMARRLVGHGYTVMRFDLKGMGDSSGQHTGYQQSRADLRSAIDHFLASEPHLRDVVLFGECASASGILFYAYSDPRVTRLALANPWVRTEEGRAEVILKYYYVDRILSRQFWRDVFAGRVGIAKSLGSLGEVVRTYARGIKAARKLQTISERDDLEGLPLPVKTAEGLRRFQGPVLIIMSGRDYIAREFDAVTKATSAWRGLLAAPRLSRYEVQGADHTFSKAEWKTDAQNALLSWLRASG